MTFWRCISQHVLLRQYAPGAILFGFALFLFPMAKLQSQNEANVKLQKWRIF